MPIYPESSPNNLAIRQHGNLYNYCLSNPCIFIDPFATLAFLATALIGAGIGAVIGAVIGAGVQFGKNLYHNVNAEKNGAEKVGLGEGVGEALASGLISGLLAAIPIPGVSGAVKVVTTVAKEGIANVVGETAVRVHKGEKTSLGDVVKEFGFGAISGAVGEGIEAFAKNITKKAWIKKFDFSSVTGKAKKAMKQSAREYIDSIKNLLSKNVSKHKSSHILNQIRFHGMDNVFDQILEKYFILDEVSGFADEIINPIYEIIAGFIGQKVNKLCTNS